MTYLITKIKNALAKFIGIDALQKQIIDLQNVNKELEERLKEHEAAIAYVSVLQIKTMKDTLAFFNAINPKKKVQIPSKKTDDDLIN